MNNDVQNLVDEIKLATDYQVNKTILREKIQTDLHFTHNGGLFKATPELISFVYAWRGADELWPWGGGVDIFLEDTYGNPISVNRSEFYKIACEHYQTVMNTWHQQHADLKKIRKI